MLVDKQIPALINGVSQQPAPLRLPSQCEAQVNCYGTIVDGLRKRPPTLHVARLSTGSLQSAYIHTINRDVSNRYRVVLTPGNLQVYDSNGAAVAVAFPHGTDYLNVENARRDFAVVSVADYTFIVNKRRTVEMAPLGADTQAQPADYYWLPRAQRDEFGGSGAVQAQYPPNPAGGIYMGVRQTIQDLPDTATNGHIYQIQGTADSAFATYYVRRNGGVWDETVRPGIRNALDATTMPHALVRKPDGTFEFAPFSWAPRRVGDENTNANPTFVGRRIRDVFFYKNRLGFCVDENVVLSRAGDFGNFYRLTVLDLLDDAAVDVGASETKVTTLNHAVAFDNAMFVMSDQVQFRLHHGDVLTPTSASLEPATQYRVVTDVRPFAMGSDLYFASEDDAWATIYEYYVADQHNRHDAANLTAHVPKYIPAGVTAIAGSSKHEALFVLTAGAPNRIYVYNFHWTGEGESAQKAQSSWGYWEFAPGTAVLDATVLDNNLELVIRRAGGTYLERLPLESGAVDPGVGFQVYVDRRTNTTGVYQPMTGTTVFTFPYAPHKAALRIIRGNGFGPASGAMLPYDSYTWLSDTQVSVPGRYDAGAVLFGENYTMRYEFSEQFWTNAQGVAVMAGRLNLHAWTVYFVDTAYFKVEVAPYGVSPETEAVLPARLSSFEGRVLDDTRLTLDAPSFASGDYTFSVWGDADVAKVTLVNDSPYGSCFNQAEWEGFMTKRSRTV